MAVLKSNLYKIMHQKGITINKLSVELKHVRSTISSLVYNEYLLYQRLPVDLIANLCEYLEVQVGELFQVVETEYISIEEIKNKINVHEYFDFICDDDHICVYNNVYVVVDEDSLTQFDPELWNISRGLTSERTNATKEEVIEWLKENVNESKLMIVNG